MGRRKSVVSSLFARFESYDRQKASATNSAPLLIEDNISPTALGCKLSPNPIR
jgi:hypothetical protein